MQSVHNLVRPIGCYALYYCLQSLDLVVAWMWWLPSGTCANY